MDIAVLALVFDFKIERLVIFGKGNNIRAVFQKCGKFKFKLTIADDFIENFP
ncbi:hypothetical protein H8E88_00210 [candidate division KSB1 bacterium]|nr:hypothetical protein [candidate division KSB1 bacterium]